MHDFAQFVLRTVQNFIMHLLLNNYIIVCTFARLYTFFLYFLQGLLAEV